MFSLLHTERKYIQLDNRYTALILILLAVFLVLGVKAMWAIATGHNGITWSLFFLFYSLCFFVIVKIFVRKLEINDNTWGIGYEVEELVGTKLASLGNEYKVLQDISKGKGKGNIDHIVIGPTGVFVIESKSNQNRMAYYQKNIQKFSGLAEEFMAQAASNALWVHDILQKRLGMKDFVHGIVVRPLNDDKKFSPHHDNRVCIMDGNAVYDHIKSFSGHLSLEEINKVHQVLREIKRQNDEKPKLIEI